MTGQHMFDAAECPNSPHPDEWMHGEQCRLCGHLEPTPSTIRDVTPPAHHAKEDGTR